MPIVAFILIAGLWAAFLLPSFFDNRNRAPKATTRDFARTQQLLEQVSNSQPDSAAQLRLHSLAKRRRVLIGLAMTALFTLVVATVMGSVQWLWLSLAIDVLFAVYVSGLLFMKQQAAVPRATVVSIEKLQVAPVPIMDEQQPVFEESLTVRVIAG